MLHPTEGAEPSQYGRNLRYRLLTRTLAHRQILCGREHSCILEGNRSCISSVDGKYSSLLCCSVFLEAKRFSFSTVLGSTSMGFGSSAFTSSIYFSERERASEFRLSATITFDIYVCVSFYAIQFFMMMCI